MLIDNGKYALDCGLELLDKKIKSVLVMDVKFEL